MTERPYLPTNYSQGSFSCRHRGWQLPMAGDKLHVSVPKKDREAEQAEHAEEPPRKRMRIFAGFCNRVLLVTSQRKWIIS